MSEVGLGTFGSRLIAAAARLDAGTSPDTVPAPACCAVPGALAEVAGDLHRRWTVAQWQAYEATAGTAERLAQFGTDLRGAADRYRDAEDDATRLVRHAGEPAP